MEVRVHDSVESFVEAAMPFLEADRALHCVHLSTVEIALRGDADLTLLSIHDNGNIIGVVTRLHPRPLHVAGMPPAAASAVADALRSVDPVWPAVMGPSERIAAFTEAWGQGGADTTPSLLYRLGSLKVPAVPGTSRLVPGETIGDWWFEFIRHTRDVTPEDASEVVRNSLNQSAVHLLWEVDGTPVSWAATTVPYAGVTRIGPVYTPPESRGHGYAAAATAAITQHALGRGVREVVLMTDAADPGPNRLYRRLGFEVVGTWSFWTFPTS